MTITTTINRRVYAGAGIVGPFPVDFKFLINADIKVSKTLIATGVATILAEGADYVLTGAGVDAGGVLNLTVALDPAYKLTIYRDPIQDQQTQFPPNDKFPAKANENAIDKLTMLCQRFLDVFARTARLPDTDVSGADPTLPVPLANATLGWDATGLKIINYLAVGALAVTGFGATLLNAANAAAARGLLLSGAAGDAIFTSATQAAARIAAGFTAIAAKGDLFAGTAANTIGTLTAGADNAALLADSTQATGLRYVTMGAGSVRQSVQQGVTDANGYANMITTGAGLRPGLSATARACIMAFAAGFGQAGAADLVSTVNADAADILGVNLPLSNTSLIHATYTNPNAVAWGQALVPPQYGYAFDRTKSALLNFEGLNNGTIFLDDFGNTWARNTNVITDTTQFKFGTASAKSPGGVTDYIETTNITSLGDGSWQMECWFRINALPAAASQAAIMSAGNAGNFGAICRLNNTAGTTKLEFLASSNGAAFDISGSTLGANTVWTLNQWNKVRMVFDALAGSYKIFLSLNGALETLDITVAAAARVCAVTRMRLFNDGGGSLNGWIDGFRFLPCVTNTSVEVPSVAAAPAIGDYPVHWFSIPEMKMYEVTAASAVAGTNPGMTNRNRLFVGEADTSGVAVTAVRSYALRGQYVSDEYAAVSGVITSKSHNIGIKPKQTSCTMICRIADFGYVPGDEKPVSDAQFDSTNHGVDIRSTRNAISSVVATGEISSISAATLAVVAPTMANWKLRLEASRGW